MQPSSLIFVLVVAIWAVFLLQHWIKRRDHLATVNSVDRFSAAMRVLDAHRPQPEATEPVPRSHTTTTTRAARPERPSATGTRDAAAPRGEDRRGPSARPAVGAPRKVRGLTFLTTLALLPVAALVAAFGPLPWWGALVWCAATLAAFGWLRRGVGAERRSAARARTTRDSGATPMPAHVEMPARVARSAPADVADPVAPQAPAATRPASRRSEVYDLVEDAPEPTPVPRATPEPGTWQPTPVPRPTYTMKAKAAAPADTAPDVPTASDPILPTAPRADVPQVIDVEDEELPAIAGWG